MLVRFFCRVEAECEGDKDLLLEFSGTSFPNIATDVMSIFTQFIYERFSVPTGCRLHVSMSDEFHSIHVVSDSDGNASITTKTDQED